MTQHLLNTLYVTNPDSYLKLQDGNVVVESNGSKLLQVPLIHLSSIVTLGETMISPVLIHYCADNGKTITLLDRNGRFKARIEGAISGNVLLRQAQYNFLSIADKTTNLVRNIVAGKIKNSRQILLRGARDTELIDDKEILSKAAENIAKLLRSVAAANDVNVLRGLEGEAARYYFKAFSNLIKPSLRSDFYLNGRTRRPPLDRMNSLISFIYTIITHDCRSALETVGLDPQFGFLHALRPGRPSLALDLVEEFRSYFADRLAITMVNRGQIKADEFEIRPGASVYINADAKRKIIIAYQERKKEELNHLLIDSKMQVGLLPFIQARLLARTISGDLDNYIPFTIK